MTLCSKKTKSFVPSTLTALTAGLLSFQASAFTPDPDDGIYVSGDGGLTLLQKMGPVKNDAGFNFRWCTRL